MRIIIFHSNIIRIGGVETFTYNMCKQLSKQGYDVLLLYKIVHPDQLTRLKKVCNVELYNSSKTYECDVCILASSWGGYPDTVTSVKNEYWQVVHANYRDVKQRYKWDYLPWYKTTRHISVSKTVAKIFKQMYGFNSKVIYNILDDIQPKKLTLISAMRYSPEKGCNRMVKLAELLKENNIPFKWTVYTAREQYPNAPYMDMPEIIYKEPTYDIFDDIRDADYGVQLSDTEGYSYFVNECLQYGTPMLCTNYDSVHECVKDGINGYILPMDMSNIDIHTIVNKIPKGFEWVPKSTIGDWVELLSTVETKKIKTPNLVNVKVITQYHDVILNRTVIPNELMQIDVRRAKYLQGLKLVEIMA